MKNIIKIIVICALYYPLLNLVLFYSYIIRVRYQLGHYPVYGADPDPNALGLKGHEQLIYKIGDILPLSFVILTFGLIVELLLKRKILCIEKLHYLMSIVFFLLIILTLLSPLMLWFGD